MPRKDYNVFNTPLNQSSVDREALQVAKDLLAMATGFIELDNSTNIECEWDDDHKLWYVEKYDSHKTYNLSHGGTWVEAGYSCMVAEPDAMCLYDNPLDAYLCWLNRKE